MKTILTLIDELEKAKGKSAKTRKRNAFIAACHKHGISAAWLLSRIAAAQNGCDAAIPTEANLIA